MKCKACESPERKIWPPSDRVPNFRRLESENWMSLVECPDCGALWAGVPYEPYTSFPYFVSWNKTAPEWKADIANNNGKALHAWHKRQLLNFQDTLDSNDLESIQYHRERSHGRDPYSKA